MVGRLQHRDAVLRSVSAACKAVGEGGQRLAWSKFRMQVLTAVSEAFNNIVLHSYAGRSDGVVEMKIRTSPNRISVELRDWGRSFDPTSVPVPDLDSLPESGLGIFIMRELMEVRYRPGCPNVLVLSKTWSPRDDHPCDPSPVRRRAMERLEDADSAGFADTDSAAFAAVPVKGEA